MLCTTLTLLFGTAVLADDADAAAVATETPDAEATLLSNVRQLTFEGRRAGEGYFSADGSKLVFQSERMADNPFYQIYLLDLETGDTERVSTGTGKTTCAWVAPSGDAVLFASTHHDPESQALQQAELDFRASGKERRYSWDYDPSYELYLTQLSTGEMTRLTVAGGYDAEASISPDGKTVLFASNRAAYADNGEPVNAERLERDPSYFIDLYAMDIDGSNVRRLTQTPGYDGGPFFSPDGSRICWRRFSEDGATAEILSANADGSDVQPLTATGAMSWAPYFHPSGKYLIYTTNVHGFGNFELYLVPSSSSAAAGGTPIRVTTTDGFDGLPVFSPDGRKLSWTSNRTASGNSQIFLADWDHEAAIALLSASSKADTPQTPARPEFAPADVVRHVQTLTAPQMQGRETGTEGGRLAGDYVASEFERLGLSPAGEDGYFAPFPFTSGVKLGDGNAVTIRHWNEKRGEWFIKTYDQYFRPLAFSATGEFDAAPIVFAGYGLQAPAAPDNAAEEYDSFVHLDVTDKWVMVFRFLPEDLTPEQRQHLSRYASLRRKAQVARDLGAKGLLVVSGPSSKVNEELVPLRFDGSVAGTSIPVVSITDHMATTLLGPDHSLADLQSALDGGDPQMGFALEEASIAATIAIEQEERIGRNVLARLQVGEQPTREVVVVGAHLDHLGVGRGGSSLARDNEADQVHQGADDNASGVAAMLEIAEALANDPKRDRFRRDLVFAAWSGEELGLLGSANWTESNLPKHPHDAEAIDAVANLNLDMVGRLRDALVIQGVGSSPEWRGLIERRNVPVGLPLTLSDDAYLPTDASEFFKRGVPILSAFTGSHEDYHTPRDTADKLNYEGTARIARLFSLLARSLALDEDRPKYEEQERPKNQERRANLRAYLGTIPDYAQSDVVGVKLSGVGKGGPAAEAGIRGGDVIKSVAGKTIENIYDYTFAIEALKIGETIDIVVERDGKTQTLPVTPGSRD